MNPEKMKRRLKVKCGRLVRVENRDRRFGSWKHYLALRLEGLRGRPDRRLLLTEDQLAEAEQRAAENPEDMPELGSWTDHWE